MEPNSNISLLTSTPMVIYLTVVAAIVELTESVLKKCETGERLHDKLIKFYDYPKFGAPFRQADKLEMFHWRIQMELSRVWKLGVNPGILLPEALGLGNWVKAQEWAALPEGQATYLRNPVPWGWEKSETKVLTLQQELEKATQQRLADEERLHGVDASLKECKLQLRFVREEQEKRIHDAVTKTSTECEKQRSNKKHNIIPSEKTPDQNTDQLLGDDDIVLSSDFSSKNGSADKLEIRERMFA
ncbi:filament-like plant protein 7 isoform X2 [Tanacetum coccineum]